MLVSVRFHVCVVIILQGFTLDDDTSDKPAEGKKEEVAPTPEPEPEPAAAAAPPPPAPVPEPELATVPAPEPVAAAVATATADDNNGAPPQPKPFFAADYSYAKVSTCPLILFCNLKGNLMVA